MVLGQISDKFKLAGRRGRMERMIEKGGEREGGVQASHKQMRRNAQALRFGPGSVSKNRMNHLARVRGANEDERLK